MQHPRLVCINIPLSLILRSVHTAFYVCCLCYTFIPCWSFSTARCLIPAERSRVVIGGMKRWPFDVTDAMVPHGENVMFYCKHPRKQCTFTAAQTCYDGKLQPPACYLGKPGPLAQATLFLSVLVSACQSEKHGGWGWWWWLTVGDFCKIHAASLCVSEPTWLQYKLFPHRLVSEIEACELGDVEWWPRPLQHSLSCPRTPHTPAPITQSSPSPLCSFASSIYATIMVC